MNTKSKTALAVLTLCVMGCSDHGREDAAGSARQPIINGWKANPTDYQSTVGLTDSYGGDIFCTGTLVAADAVITAAHCVGSIWSPKQLKVVYDAGGVAPLYLDVAKIDVHPEYSGPNTKGCIDQINTKCVISNDRPWSDVALLTLKNIASNPSCTPILPSNKNDAYLSYGQTVRIAGYGSNWIEDSGVLYATDVNVQLRTATEIEVGEDHGDAKDTPNACFGDSGGPMFVMDEGVMKVAGITSRSAYKPECGHGSIYELPGSFLAWFQDTYTKNTCLMKWEKADAGAAVLAECLNAGTDLTITSGCANIVVMPPAEPKAVKVASDGGGVIDPVSDAGKPPPPPSADSGSSRPPGKNIADDSPSGGCAVRPLEKKGDIVAMIVSIIAGIGITARRVLRKRADQ